MRLLVFPSRKRPQFYVSDNADTISFFIHHFLYSGKSELQFFINILRKSLPAAALHIVLRAITGKEKQLPEELSEKLGEITEYIETNRALFNHESGSSKEISFILRKGAWHRADDKMVIILFSKGSIRPFAIAKVGAKKHTDSIEKEFISTKTVYSKFSNNTSFTIPAPLGFYASDRIAVYFEQPLDGTPYNNYVKTRFFRRERQHLMLDLLKKGRDLAVQFNLREQILSSRDFDRYFTEPFENLYASGLGTRYSLQFSELKKQLHKLQSHALYAVWMHGDLWGGSVLFGQEQVGVIDWEFFSERGVPLWDFFSVLCHVGAALNNKNTADFTNYFTDRSVAQKADEYLTSLSEQSGVSADFIPCLFQSYLLYNILSRDRGGEDYWQRSLVYYWNIAGGNEESCHRLLL